MKKILLPVDNSIHSIHALQYTAMLTPILQDFTYSLFYVQPVLSDFVMEEARKDPAAVEELKRLNKRNADRANEILNLQKERLLKLDVPEESIELSSRRRKEGVGRDILKHAREESVDAIVMGRRGFSKFQDTFIGSTTKNVIEHNTDIPVWVVDGEISSKNILLAVDGSTDTVKALDYLCNILRTDPDTKLTFFHVQPSLTECCVIDFSETERAQEEEQMTRIFEKANRQCIDNFMGHAWRKLKERKISEDRLQIKTQPARLNIGKAVLEEFKNGDYGTLIVGKRGINKRFFMGSVSNYLMTHLANGALWIVP